MNNLLPASYLDFLIKHPQGLISAQYKPENHIGNNDNIFVTIWNNEEMLRKEFSDECNYLMPKVIVDNLENCNLDVCFNPPDFFSKDEVKNMIAFGMYDSSFISFNPADCSVNIVYPDGFVKKIADSFENFILNIHE